MTNPPGDRREPEQADHYRHDDGTVEIVLAVEDDRILSLKEYADGESFAASVAESDYLGTNAEVAALPDVESVRDEMESLGSDRE